MEFEATTQKKTNAGEIILKAVLNVCRTYNIGFVELGDVLLIDVKDVARYVNKLTIDNKTVLMRAVLFLKLIRRLEEVSNRDLEKSAAWLLSHNSSFNNSRPIDRIKAVSGMGEVMEYLDRITGRF